MRNHFQNQVFFNELFNSLRSSTIRLFSSTCYRKPASSRLVFSPMSQLTKLKGKKNPTPNKRAGLRLRWKSREILPTPHRLLGKGAGSPQPASLPRLRTTRSLEGGTASRGQQQLGYSCADSCLPAPLPAQRDGHVPGADPQRGEASEGVPLKAALAQGSHHPPPPPPRSPLPLPAPSAPRERQRKGRQVKPPAD